MNEAVVKETFGEVRLLGLQIRHPYDQETRTRDESQIESILANVACMNLDEAVTVQVNTQVVPNIRKWGHVKFEGLVYNPGATASSFTGDDGNVRSFGRVNERFIADNILPLTPGDRVADENGEKVSIEKK